MAVLRSHHIKARKKFGQNFLVDENVLETTVEAANVTENDFVLEIGPGIGTLTQYLAYHARKVCAVEIDGTLLPVLEDTLSAYKNVEILHGDILKMDLADIARKENGGAPIRVAANLPYYITTPVVMKLLEGGAPIQSITVMVQKEVADRMAASPGTKDYGALSLAVQYYAEPKCVRIVHPDSFIPQPGVDSALMHMEKYETPPVEVEDTGQMFALIRAAFQYRRKKLVNAVELAGTLPFSKKELEEALEKIGLDAAVRGEALDIQKYAELSDVLGKSGENRI